MKWVNKGGVGSKVGHWGRCSNFSHYRWVEFLIILDNVLISISKERLSPFFMRKAAWFSPTGESLLPLSTPGFSGVPAAIAQGKDLFPVVSDNEPHLFP